jgi:NAD(P)-dependent dehydrogenase (short-subunit alcohol dehydrogenase family)
METALVAGVGPGLGSALARALAREGFALGLFARRPESSEPAAAAIREAGGRARSFAVDVTDREAVFSAVAALRKEFGPITALAYNAGGYGRGPFLELDPETIRRSFEVATMGAVHVAQAVIPDMLEAGHGAISFTGATASLRGREGFAPLAIAKASLRVLAQSLAREFHPQGIHVVHVIVDGQIDTPGVRERSPDRGSQTLIPPDAIAAAILHAFKQPKNAWTHELDIRPCVEKF